MMKALSLALLLVASPAIAAEPSLSCFPVAITINTAPAKESGRLEGDKLAKFKVGIAHSMKTDSDMVPADADTVILFRLNDNFTGFAVAKGGCTLGTGQLPNKLLDKAITGDDGSI